MSVCVSFSFFFFPLHTHHPHPLYVRLILCTRLTNTASSLRVFCSDHTRLSPALFSERLFYVLQRAVTTLCASWRMESCWLGGGTSTANWVSGTKLKGCCQQSSRSSKVKTSPPLLTAALTLHLFLALYVVLSYLFTSAFPLTHLLS